MKRSLALITVFVCGCIFGEPHPDEEPSEAPAECRTGDVLEKDARPFERIALDIDIDGVQVPRSATSQPPDVWAEFELGEAIAYVQIEWDHDEEEWFFLAPIHLGTPFEGGDMSVRIRTDEVSCDTQTLEIEPLERAPGTLAAYVDKQRQLSELKAASLGLDYEELATRPILDVPAPMIGPLVARNILDDTDNPNSLAAVADGTATNDELADSIELVDAVLAAAGVVEKADQEIADYRSLEPFEEPPVWSRTAPFRTTHQPLCEQLPTDILYPVISNPATLSKYMIRANISQKALDDPIRKGFSSFVGYAGLIPIPISKGAAAIVQSILFFQKRTYEWHANGYPRALLDPEAKLTIEEFNEDSEDEGTYEEYRISATSKEWNITKDLVGELVDIIGGAVSGKIAVKIEGQVSEAQKILLEQAMANAQKDLTDIIAQIEPEGCVLPAHVWPKIGGFENPSYHVSEFSGAIKRSENVANPVGVRTRYQVEKPGNGIVELKVPANAFPPVSNVEASTWEGTVKVEPIEVTIRPDGLKVDPGSTLTVRAEVDHADDERVMWEDSVNEIQRAPYKDWFEIISSNEESATIRFKLDAPDDKNILIYARSISQNGIRLGKIHSEPRDGVGVYRVGPRIDVRPKYKCFDKDERFTFEAEVFGDEEDKADWNATIGSVDSDGNYRATEEGRGRVIANPEGDPDEQDWASVQVGNCDCEWNFELIGGLSGIWGDTTNASAVLNNGVLAMTFGGSDDDFFSGNIIAMGMTRQTGTFPASASAKNTENDNPVDSAQTYEDSGELTITHWDDFRIEGFFVGTGFAIPDLLNRDVKPILFRVNFNLLIGNYDENPQSLLNNCETGVVSNLF